MKESQYLKQTWLNGDQHYYIQQLGFIVFKPEQMAHIYSWENYIKVSNQLEHFYRNIHYTLSTGTIIDITSAVKTSMYKCTRVNWTEGMTPFVTRTRRDFTTSCIYVMELDQVFYCCSSQVSRSLISLLLKYK